MTVHRENHLNRIINWFSDLVRPKYLRGQQEHGGNLWIKPGMLRNIKEEVTDLAVYVQTLEEQLEERYPEAYSFFTGEEKLIKKYERKRPRIYVAGPYSGKTSWQIDMHIQIAKEYAHDIWQDGGAALCPHLNTARFDNDVLGHQDFLDGDFEWIAVSDAVFLLPRWEASQGAIQEKDFAESLQIPVFKDYNHLKVWIGSWKEKHATINHENPPCLDPPW